MRRSRSSRAPTPACVGVGGRSAARPGRGLSWAAGGGCRGLGCELGRQKLGGRVAEFGRLEGCGGGRVAIGAIPMARARLLPGAVMALHRQWPDATVEIDEGSHAELLEPLRD